MSRAIKSIRVRTNAAFQKRKDGEKQPSVGAISHQAHNDYNENPERYRLGKKVLRRVNALAQDRFGRVRSVFTVSNALEVDGLRKLRIADP